MDYKIRKDKQEELLESIINIEEDINNLSIESASYRGDLIELLDDLESVKDNMENYSSFRKF